jgi:hypothetical protein
MAAPSFIEFPQFEQVLIKWEPPSPAPGVITHYDLALDVSKSNPNGNIIYSGLLTQIIISTPPILNFHIRASTVAGTGPYSSPSQPLTEPKESKSITNRPEFYIPVLICLLLIAALLVMLLLRWRRNKGRNTDNVFVKPTPDEWEVDPVQIILGKRLGEGNFGVVYSASAYSISADLPGPCVVAVKMISEQATVDEKRAFLHEADLMKKFSKPWHENVRDCSFNLILRDHIQGDSVTGRMHTDRKDDDRA